MSVPNPPRSPTLVPPRKSVELEDPGAHELESSEAEEDVFADAQEDRSSHSGPSSPIPTTRVEKVDDRESHGEVPGTAAYKLRTQDAVPDELEVVPEGQSRSRPESPGSRPQTPGGDSIPTTVVEKVDPSSSSHGDVPGTKAFNMRMADAVPDIIRPASAQNEAGLEGTEPGSISSDIPTTIITKVDSEPSHGEVPGTEAFNMRMGDAKPDVVEQKKDVTSESPSAQYGRIKQQVNGNSPIAADGGFGFAGSDSDDNDTQASTSIAEDVADDAGEGSGDDFDDFEAGNDDDFGDFDETTQTPSIPSAAENEPENEVLPSQSLPVPDIPFPLLDFGDLDSIEDILDTTKPYFDHIFSSSQEASTDPPPSFPNTNSIFLTERSHSLWSQLVAPPPLQPPNWVRSRIRRLFLVSLGVPIDLDEILPASKQKKLILPSIHTRSDSPSPANGQRTASGVRLKHENASSTSIDKGGSSAKSKRRKGPPAAPDLDLQATRMLCATTEAALSNMTDTELRAHVQKIEELTNKASEVLEYWLRRRDSALGEKEAFEGVIENLVKHARRVRK